MLCYRDMTFCQYWKICVDGDTCFRALKQQVVLNARLAGLPICQFARKPDCYKEADK